MVMKVIVIGPSLSGKTTLARYLRSHSRLSISEIDEELTKLNNGQYPSDDQYKHTVLAPQIIKNVLAQTDLVFFANTDYFTWDDLKAARANGFRIVCLSLGKDEFLKRNEGRMKNEGYDDMSRWLDGMLAYQRQLQDQHLADQVIDASLPTEKIAEMVMDFSEKK